MNNNLFHEVIKNPEDLITPYSSTVDGFINQAKHKYSKATKVLDDAKKIFKKFKNCNDSSNLFKDPILKQAALASAGYSKKAINYLDEYEIKRIIKSTFTNLDSPKANNEMFYRYLLTAGDTLGGSMRNLTGLLAQEKLVDAIISHLDSIGKKHKEIKSQNGKTQIITFDNRTILFDKTPTFINKNIDVVLITGKYSNENKSELLENKNNYIAMGELKGGIDPAGADEHWKTASKALERIRVSFKSMTTPQLFFIGNAIESSMAIEIYEEVKISKLSFAANLSSDEQVSALVKWLVSL